MTLPYFADPVDAALFGQRQQAQAEEYGTYVAAMDIPVGTVLGFAKGSPVPKSTAEREGWAERGWVVPIAEAPAVGDRAQELRARRAALADEQARLDAEIAAAEAASESESDDTAGEDGGDRSGLTVDQLKAELGSRGLPTSGTKPELIARLRAADTEE